MSRVYATEASTAEILALLEPELAETVRRGMMHPQPRERTTQKPQGQRAMSWLERANPEAGDA